MEDTWVENFFVLLCNFNQFPFKFFIFIKSGSSVLSYSFSLFQWIIGMFDGIFLYQILIKLFCELVENWFFDFFLYFFKFFSKPWELILAIAVFTWFRISENIHDFDHEEVEGLDQIIRIGPWYFNQIFPILELIIVLFLVIKPSTLSFFVKSLKQFNFFLAKL